MIIRTDKNQHYTTLANFALNDENLSLKAKGLWAFIMSKPDGWSISSRGLEPQLKEGRDAIMSALKELEEAGYLIRGDKRLENGRWTSGSNVLHEQPVVGKSHHGKLNHGKAHHIVKTEQVKTEQVITTDVVISADAPVNYGKPEINEMFLYWEQITGVGISSNVKSNRNACNSLIKRHGIEVLRRVIDGVAISQGDKYAPRISNFTSLQAKWDDLMVWGKQQKNNSSRIVKI